VNGRFKKLRLIEDKIMEDYLENDMNMSEIAKVHGVHYSNLRRFIKAKIKELGLEENFNVQYINVEDFRWLDIGDTFSFGEWLTTWRVNKVVEKENELVFELVPTSKTSRRNWVCGVNTPEGF
jgi:hypothetical protein